MTIQCQICNKVFEKQITNSHLKSHNISTTSYKEIYGIDSLSSREYKDSLSKSRIGEANPNFNKKWTKEQKMVASTKLRGKLAWNKGKKLIASEKLIEGIKQREKKYKAGVLVRPTHALSEEQKAIISKKVSNYAKENPNEMRRRAQKAIETKKASGHDFTSPFKGKKHTNKTKETLAMIGYKHNALRKAEAVQHRLLKINESNLTLVQDNGSYLILSCNICHSTFTLTKQYFTDSKYKTDMCYTCFPRKAEYRSKAEIELFEFVKSICPDASHSNRTLLNGRKEIDILVPSEKLAIEFNGLYWHSEKLLLQAGKNKTADHEKKVEVESLGYRYIGIFEDEWKNNKDIVCSRLSNILHTTPCRIPARKCKVVDVSSSKASEFCRNNHLQGSGRSNFRCGLEYNGELVSVMTFSKNNISRKINTWELNRFCNKIGTTVIGGAGRLFSYFIKTENPKTVISYADSRWSSGNLYKQLNFTFEKNTVPNYWYADVSRSKRIHRYTLRKKIGESANRTEKELRTSEGFLIIWDCGSSKWLWEASSI